MKYRSLIINILIIIISTSGCYLPIDGRVIDAQTQKPIEGAIVMVEWTKTHGFGHYWTESYKVVEAESDKEGKVKIDGCYSPFINPPSVTVYKKGYVAWNSKAIFRGSQRTDFRWGDYVFRLDQFKEEYSHDDHADFIRTSIISSLNVESKLKIFNAFSWEDELASQERYRKSK